MYIAQGLYEAYMKFIQSDFIIDDIMRPYFLYDRDYNISLSSCHAYAYSLLETNDPEYESIVDKFFVETVSKYIANYSLHIALGKTYMKNADKPYKNIIDIRFEIDDEMMVVFYND